MPFLTFKRTSGETKSHRFLRKLEGKRPTEKLAEAIQVQDGEAVERDVEFEPDSRHLVSVHVSHPTIEEQFEASIQSENSMREETDDASSIYPDDEATELVPPAYQLSDSIDPDHYLSTVQALEIKQEIAELWSELCLFDEDRETTIPPPTSSSSSQTPSTISAASISSTASTDETESPSSQRLSSNSSYHTAETTTSSKISSNGAKNKTLEQRRPFTLNGMLELDSFCERRQESSKRGGEWVDLLWRFEDFQHLFLGKYGWMPYIERMEEFEMRREMAGTFGCFGIFLPIWYEV